jgi:hypothetical protein
MNNLAFRPARTLQIRFYHEGLRLVGVLETAPVFIIQLYNAGKVKRTELRLIKHHYII